MVVANFGFAVRFPKLVEIANPRLIMLYSIMQATCIAVLTWWFVSAKFWEKEETFGQHIRANMWIGYDSDSSAFTERLEALSASLCAQMEDYNYWYDKEGFWRYGNFTCTLPCKPGQTKGCMSMQEAHSNRDVDEAFLVTHQQTTQLNNDGQVEGVEDSFVLTAEAMDVSISYFYDLPTYGWDGSVPAHSQVGHKESFTSRDVATHLMDSTGATRKVFSPGEEIKLSLPLMLELSGDRSGLDGLNANAGMNMAPGAQPRPAPTRLSGMELELHIDCYPHAGGDLVGCYVSVVRSQRGWAYERRFERNPSGGHRVVVFHGIRLVLMGGGMQRHFHMTTLMSKLTTCVVLMSIPNKLLSLICITLLGHLSVIYRQAIIDTFSLKDYMAGMSARLMVWNASFVELVDKHLPSGESGISKRRMHERLKSVLKSHKELDPHEVRQLVDYCFKAICNPTKKGGWRMLSKHLEDITTEIGLSEEGGQIAARFLDSSNFSGACTSNEHINFSSAVALFDKERRRSFLERLFTPRHFAEYTWARAESKGEDGTKSMDSMDSDESCEKEEHPDLREVEFASEHEAATTHISISSHYHRSASFASSLSHPEHVHSVSQGSRRDGSTGGLEHYDPTELTLESEKQVSRHLPRRVAKLMKDHQALREHCKEQLNFLDRVYHHLEHRFQELSTSLEQWQRAAEHERQAVQKQQKAAQQEREEAGKEIQKLERALQEHRSSVHQDKEELQRGLEALRESLNERMTFCEESLQRSDKRGRLRRSKTHSQVDDAEQPKRSNSARQQAGEEELPQANVATDVVSEGSMPQALSPQDSRGNGSPVDSRQSAAPHFMPPREQPWEALFRGTLSRPT